MIPDFSLLYSNLKQSDVLAGLLSVTATEVQIYLHRYGTTRALTGGSVSVVGAYTNTSEVM
jgi:hypothetical protein